uniref:DUF7730 domain-containing protein n=1 Tax=Coccidioides posadasii RMSCC 3488 TaxID=454284 RepID=A0A0J6F672_COCPO|nr:hypothetical protein CPAG_04763 [Coccidioides posadasii RMSCC 3488]
MGEERVGDLRYGLGTLDTPGLNAKGLIKEVWSLCHNGYLTINRKAGDTPSLALRLPGLPSRRRRESREQLSRFPLLSLPPEIREEVYRFYFGPEAIHLASDQGRITSYRCKQTDPSPVSDCCTRPYCIAYFQTAASENDGNSRVNTALLYTCRQIYREASAMLYRSVIFQTNAMVTWVLFAGMISPGHLAMVKGLRACWIALPCLTMAPIPPNDPRYPEYEHYTVFMDGHFREFWEILGSRMSGLQDLGFVMDYTGQFLSRAVTAEWHRQLTKVTGLKRLDLQIWDTFGGAQWQTGRDEAKAAAEMEVLMEYLKKRMCSRARCEVSS